MRLFYKIVLIIYTLLWGVCSVHASVDNFSVTDSILIDSNATESLLVDSIPLLQNQDMIIVPHYIFLKPLKGNDSVHFVDLYTFKFRADSLLSIPTSRTDSLLYRSNSLTLPLVYSGIDIREINLGFDNLSKRLYSQNKSLLFIDTMINLKPEFAIADLRRSARTYLANNNMSLYETTVNKLPSLSSFMSRPIQRQKLNQLNIYDDKIVLHSNKIEYETVKPIYWTKTANAQLQFSQNYVSQNWHQGGSSNLALLSIFTGTFNYADRKKIQWDNKIEWRSGFNSVDGDTLRKVRTNDDLLRYITKFGVKASGNWYYSLSGEFSTLLFNNYKAINSTELKARLLTPVRATIGLGMDYKYKKVFSLMLAPVTFKYIYLNDTVNVNPNLFGIEKGENQLKQIGSSLLAQLTYSPMLNWNLTSKLSFYTDYSKIEVDWEIVNNFTINRFLNARLLINPRYDNTVILNKGEKARIQLKELLSFGFAYRLL